MIRITDYDFFTGLFLALRLRGRGCFSFNLLFETATYKVFKLLLALSEKRELYIPFRMVLHPIHGDSAVFRHNILSCMQRGLVTLDFPLNDVIRFRMDEELAEKMLADIPGGKDLFLELADEFLRLLRGESLNVQASTPY